MNSLNALVVRRIILTLKNMSAEETFQMPKVIRTIDFVSEVKDLSRKGYTKADISKKLSGKYAEPGKTLSSKV
ncbi:hypothetical protein ACT54J_18450, partial [Leptospira interrogans]